MTAQHVFRSVAIVALCLFGRIVTADTAVWVARAADVPQIDSIDLGGSYSAGESISVTIGHSTLTVTAGADTTTLSVLAQALRNAINAPTIDGSLVGSEKRNAAGQLLPEFRDVEAVIDPADDTVVLVRSKVAGVPFYDAADGSAPLTLSVAESSASGTITATSVQAATGKHWWSNAKNWSTGAVPADGDDIVLSATGESILYGLPLTADEFAPASLTIDQSFTGWFGLPAVNQAGPYREYRPRAADLRDDGTDPNSLVITVGRGEGAGSPLVNLQTTMVHANSTCTYNIYNTGTANPALSDYACNIHYVANGTGADLAVSGGSIHLERVDVNDVTINPSQTVCRVLFDEVVVVGGGGAITISGGEIEYRTASSQNLVMHAGTLRFLGTVPDTLQLYGGTAQVINAAGGTIDALLIAGSGVFDLSRCTTPLTISECDLFRGATLLDPLKQATYTDGIDLNQCDVGDVTLRVGAHRGLTLGTPD